MMHRDSTNLKYRQFSTMRNYGGFTFRFFFVSLKISTLSAKYAVSKSENNPDLNWV